MTLHEDTLPEETKKLWKQLENEPLLTDALLVGGSALSLRIAHRRSEDLDFVFTSPTLPREKINALSRKFPGWRRDDNPAVYDEFLLGGMSLHDFQQDFLSDTNVKITFFSEDAKVSPMLRTTPEPGPKIAELSELFMLKALVCAKRSSSRDWYDLHVLLTKHGFTLLDFESVFHSADRIRQLDSALERLCAGQTDKADPGFQSLTDNPPSPQDLATFFREARDAYEIQKSARELGKPEKLPENKNK